MAQQAPQSPPERFQFFKESHWKITGNVASKINGSHGAAIGEKAVSSGMHQWLIQYDTTKRCCGCLGICSTTSDQILGTYPYNVAGSVSFHHPGESSNCYAFYNDTGSRCELKRLSKPLKSGDQVRIILDIQQKKVTFYQNGEVAFQRTGLPTGGDKKYRVYVDGDGTGDKYTILESQATQSPPERFKFFNESNWKITGNVASSINGSHGAAIGEKAVSSGIHQWLIQYDTTNRCCGFIGICSTTSDQILGTYPYDVAGTVSVYHSGTSNCTAYYNDTGSRCTLKSLNKPLKSGDQVRIILDIQQKKVTFYQNGEFAFERTDLPTGGDKKYRLCVDGDNTGDKYTILESQGAFPAVSIQPVLSALSALNDELQSFDMQRLAGAAVEDLITLKQEFAKFPQECKEFEQTFDSFKEKVKQFEAAVETQLKPDPKGYKSWSADQMCRYVLSLEDGRFAKYKDVWSEAILKQQIKGVDLPKINASDLTKIGITGMEESKALAKHLSALADH